MNAAVDTSQYYEFYIRANANFKLNLDSVVIGERRSNTGISKFSVRSSLDNFTTDLKVFDLPDDAFYRYNQNTPLGNVFKNVPAGNNVAFRFYGYAAEGAAGTWRLDSVRVWGSIVPAVSNPTLSWSKVSDSIPECLGQTTVMAVLSQAMNEDITFQVNATGTVALSDLDPIDFSSPIIIPAGQTTTTFSFSTIDNAIHEANRSLILTLDTISGGVVIGTNPTYTLSILDDDSPAEKYQFKAKTDTVVEGNTAQIKIRLHATSKVPPGGMVKVEVSGGSAISSDYSSTQFGPFPLTSDSIFTLNISALNDGIAEPDGDSLIITLRSNSPTGFSYLGSDTVFVLYIKDAVMESFPPTRTIAEIRGNNTNGGADSVGKKFRIYGTVYGLNQRLTPANSGYQMYLRDATGGIALFKTSSVNGINDLVEGDSVKVMGNIEVFRGLTQINPDSMVRLATGRTIKTPTITNSVNESLESDLIRINGVQLVNPANWTTGVGATGFTIKIFKGTDTTEVRIDNDCPLYNQPAPSGTFDIIGMGNQFIPGALPLTPPYLGYYQLIPRKNN